MGLGHSNTRRLQLGALDAPAACCTGFAHAAKPSVTYTSSIS